MRVIRLYQFVARPLVQALVPNAANIFQTALKPENKVLLGLISPKPRFVNEGWVGSPKPWFPTTSLPDFDPSGYVLLGASSLLLLSAIRVSVGFGL